MPGTPELTVIVLAAGGGTRMKSKTMKVLHPLAGRSMIGHVLAAARALEPTRIVAVVGHQREQVSEHIAQIDPGVVLAVQETQEGTGHAVKVAVEALGKIDGTVLVITGDTPLLEAQTLKDFADQHARSAQAVSILSGIVADPTNYGRIIREQGHVMAIVEQKECDAEQVLVNEINSGILAFEAQFLTEALTKLEPHAHKAEYYLTDTVSIAKQAGLEVGAMPIDDWKQTEGVNDRAQLAALAQEKNARILKHWMAQGVTIIDPATTWIDVEVTLAPDVTVLPGVQLLGTTAVAEDAVVGPDSTLKDCEVGAGARVVRTHAELAVIGEGATVGPFSYLRPGTVLGASGKIGAFVETKNATIGTGSKVPHLSYVGDAVIGEMTNIGAGTIFANYDGVNKHSSRIGSHVRTGSDNVFVAPVSIGDGAVTGAGSIIRRDVPAGALAVSGGQQRHIEGWIFRKRPDSSAAQAAQSALDADPGVGPGAVDKTES